MGLDWDRDGFIISFSFSFSLYHPLLYFYYTSVGHNVVRAGIYWSAKSPISTSYKSRWLEDIRDGPPDWSGDGEPISNHGRIFHCTHTHSLSLLLSHVSATSLILLLPRSLISRDPLSRKRVRDNDATIIDGVTGWALRLDGALGSLPLGTCSPTPSFITGVFFFRAFSSAVVLHFVIVSYLKSFSTLAFCIKEA